MSVICKKCKKIEPMITLSATFIPQGDNTYLCPDCYIEMRVCSICGKNPNNLEQANSKYVQIEDEKFICEECCLKTVSCIVCGSKPTNLSAADSQYKRIGGDIVCINCAKEYLMKKSKNIIISSTNNIENKRIDKYLGFNSVEIVIGTGIFSEVTSEMSDIFGMRSTIFEKKLSEAKNMAELLLKEKAINLGANAVIGVDLDYTEFTGNRVGLMLSGTFVKFEG